MANLTGAGMASSAGGINKFSDGVIHGVLTTANAGSVNELPSTQITGATTTSSTNTIIGANYRSILGIIVTTNAGGISGLPNVVVGAQITLTANFNIKTISPNALSASAVFAPGLMNNFYNELQASSAQFIPGPFTSNILHPAFGNLIYTQPLVSLVGQNTTIYPAAITVPPEVSQGWVGLVKSQVRAFASLNPLGYKRALGFSAGISVNIIVDVYGNPIVDINNNPFLDAEVNS